MKSFSIKINLDNDSFVENERELSSILEKLSERFLCGFNNYETGILFDSNGNRVGEFIISEENPNVE